MPRAFVRQGPPHDHPRRNPPRLNDPHTHMPGLGQCPECGEALAPSARGCACGWKSKLAGQPNRPPPLPCDTPGCSDPAFCRVADKNVCRKCYATAATHKLAANKAVDRSYRANWYREKGKPYEPPKVGSFGGIAGPLMAKRQREPGEDSREDIEGRV